MRTNFIADYRVTVIDREPATHDERDGFGDFVNYKEYPLGTIGASSPAEAIELMRFMCPSELQSSMKAVLQTSRIIKEAK